MKTNISRFTKLKTKFRRTKFILVNNKKNRFAIKKFMSSINLAQSIIFHLINKKLREKNLSCQIDQSDLNFRKIN